MIRVKLTHITDYTYDRPVRLSPHVVRLRPAPHTRTIIESYSLSVDPARQFLNWQQDPFANWQARLVFPEPTRQLSVRVDLVAQIRVFNPFDFFTEEYAAKYPFEYAPRLKHELLPYLAVTGDSPRLRAFAADFTEKDLTIVDFIVALNQYVRNHVGYVIRLEPGVQSPHETLEKKSGSCRDSAYLLVQLARCLGLAARFVSGYLIQLKADKPGEGELKGAATDFTDLHAWAEIFIPGAGWVGLDATSGLLAAEGHIPLAATPEPENAAAIDGFTDPCESELAFSMKVQRLTESARVTRPYNDAVWASVEKLAAKIDADLEKNDVRLSIGGEPTFVSATDRESRQWNYDALGADKYRHAELLLARFYEIYAKGGIVLRSQGKWYPGEILPRWSLDCFWLRDGKPLWHSPGLLLHNGEAAGAVLGDAERFITDVAGELGLPAECIHTAFEDPVYYLYAEAKLPPEFEKIIKGNSYPEIERRRLLRVLDTGLEKPVGFALPLTYNATGQHWESAELEFRRGFMSLLPGDSPMGLRLPLDSITDAWQQDYHHDPVANGRGDVRKAPSAGRIRRDPIRTFLCAEVRGGALHVFLPPVNTLEEFCGLLSVIEAVAKRRELRLNLEGYEPPKDSRLNFFRITPDPGVIEVNMFPSASLVDSLAKTRIIYEEAERTGLTTDRYMLDGRACATGGGNHITLGALHSEDSPFLRKPHLLASLVAYWQNHPSLSYVFSGLFIGPTSQAPRLDEARDGQVAEAEIALTQIRRAETLPLWQIDRILRNILVDITGNTHRAEISIDKLYAPGSYTGRLGLVELRGFEMPPHYQMSVVQQLLVAGLLSWFWREPYRHPLTRWGSSLRDEWMLPFYLERDLMRVLHDLSGAGYAFAFHHVEPFFEFRFPVYGTYRAGGFEIELRMALEPWNVLGEEVVSGSVSRAVDSATERVQVLVRGNLKDTVITCNGYALPLRYDRDQDCHVAGVVFKAWSPPFTLHPTVPVHSPLQFGIYDRRSRQYTGGCSYHTSHPGGRAYEKFPVNSYEAESRRLSRFLPQARYPQVPPIKPMVSDFPHTLDLRREG